MPTHRIFPPDADVLGRAAPVSGILCRLQGYDKSSKLRASGLCAISSGTKAWSGRSDCEYQRLRYPPPAHSKRTCAVLSFEMNSLMFDKAFDDISLGDLQVLVEARIPKGRRLGFKRDNHGHGHGGPINLRTGM